MLIKKEKVTFVKGKVVCKTTRQQDKKKKKKKEIARFFFNNQRTYFFFSSYYLCSNKRNEEKKTERTPPSNADGEKEMLAFGDCNGGIKSVQEQHQFFHFIQCFSSFSLREGEKKKKKKTKE